MLPFETRIENYSGKLNNLLVIVGHCHSSSMCLAECDVDQLQGRPPPIKFFLWKIIEREKSE